MEKQIECRSCLKQIEEDSLFCKHCGSKTAIFHSMPLDEEKLASIFQGVFKTLYSNSKYSEQEFVDKFDGYKKFETKIRSDNDYYKLLVEVVFYSGFRASTVERYLETIHKHFPDYKSVVKYKFNDTEKIKNDPNMIQNYPKIDACITNAKKIEEIVIKFGSVQAYIDSYNPNSSDECLFRLKKSLEKYFSYIGGVTSYHYMTDIGLNVLKPDRVILRIFYRLGLIESENDYFGAIKVGRDFSKATNHPIRYIDIIFVLYGQLNQEKIECICSEKNPKCQKCGVRADCRYSKELGV